MEGSELGDSEERKSKCDVYLFKLNIWDLERGILKRDYRERNVPF